MAFCLAGALSFNLAGPENDDNRPVFAQHALQVFRKFGFQLVIVATVQNATTIQPYIDSVVMVSKTEPTGRNARPVASPGLHHRVGHRRRLRLPAHQPWTRRRRSRRK